MTRIRFLLTHLLQQAFDEFGEETPALTSIFIERASERFQPRLVAEFSNGRRISETMRATDFYAFCERHSTLEFDGVRAVLLSQGLELYSQMLENLTNDCTCGAPTRPIGQPEISGRRRRLREWLTRPWFQDALAHTTSSEARARGIKLLTENLSPAQRDQYLEFGYFDVVGGNTGKHYRIRSGSQMNVEELDQSGCRVGLLCFVPEGALVVGDVMLAQKFSLELFEKDALQVANKFPSRHWLHCV